MRNNYKTVLLNNTHSYTYSGHKDDATADLVRLIILLKYIFAKPTGDE